MRKVSVFLVMLLALGLLLCGCGTTAPTELDHNTAYPLSPAEYQMSVNQKLAPLISNLQPLAKADTIDSGQAEKALQQTEDVYQAIAGLNPPKDKITYQADLLSDLSAISDHLKYCAGMNDEAPDTTLADLLIALETSFRVSAN